jgi:phage terminase large subunit
MPPTQKRKARNPTGKGGFGERPQDINVGGAPRKGQSWAEVVKRITDMTRDEAMEYVGKNTRLGKLLKELPPKLPLKDAMVFASIVHYGREPNARMFQALTDREEGKPKEPTAGGDDNKAPFSIPAELIAPDFLNVYRDILGQRHTEYLLYGGRGSTKSSFVSLVVIWLIVNNPTWHWLAARQVGNTMRDSVYSQLVWAINELGMSDSFRCLTSPLQITYIPTGQNIYFRGLDDVGKIKSLKPPFGYLAGMWVEEADQAKSAEALRKVEQSLRGGDVMFYFKTWNPPRSAQNWINKYVRIDKPNQYKHSSNYLSVPREWLGEAWLAEAETLKELNNKAYLNEYLGQITGTGGTVFENVVEREITDKEIKSFNSIYNGLDFGYAIDPAHYVRCSYNPSKRILHIFAEVRKWKTSNEDLYKAIKENGYNDRDLLIADSAEPKSVGDFKSYGANARGSEKPAGSVRRGLRWLENLASIVIDPKRCPYTAEEFVSYEYETNAQGEYISEYPDRANHSLDAVRYALSIVTRRAGE